MFKKYQQLIPNHKPDEGLYGDCWRASIACLLGVEPKEVPHPFEKGEIPWEDAVEVINEYLYDCELRCIEFPFRDAPKSFGLHNFTNEYWMLMGQSSNGKHNHIVIMKGDQFIHSTNKATVVGPSLDNGHYWCSLLIHQPKS